MALHVVPVFVMAPVYRTCVPCVKWCQTHTCGKLVLFPKETDCTEVVPYNTATGTAANRALHQRIKGDIQALL